MTGVKINVLVVDDEKLLSWSLAQWFANCGFSVRSVFNGRDALKQIHDSRYDLILLDYGLPDLEGIEVARCARSSSPGTAIILHSAFELKDLNLDPGLIDGYFNKPVDLGALSHAVETILANKRPQETSRPREPDLRGSEEAICPNPSQRQSTK